MSINKIEMQDDKGNTYYPHTDASIVKYGDSDVATELSDKANDTDNSRTTTSKTVTGAINELNSNKASLASPNFTGTPTVVNKTIATTESITLTLLNGWTNVYPICCTKSGGIVSISGVLGLGIKTLDTTIFNLPLGFRPKQATKILLTQDNNGIIAFADILTNGNCNCNVLTANLTSEVMINCSFSV